MKFTLDTLASVLMSMGFKNIKKISGKKLGILTDDNRVQVLEKVKKKLKGSKYDSTPTSESSVGKVIIEEFSILAKPASKQGSASAGVANEKALVDAVNKYAKKGPININFVASNKKYKILGCIKAESVGADTKNRKKADVVLIDKKGKQYHISIKKDDAEMWESADSYFSERAANIIKKAVKNKKTKLVSHGSHFTIEPNLAVKASSKETKDVVFGSDILPDGAIITKTFAAAAFKIVDDTLTVTCSHIITELRDVKGEKEVFFLIRNDKTRKSVKDYPGIRIIAAYRKRINDKVVVVKE